MRCAFLSGSVRIHHQFHLCVDIERISSNGDAGRLRSSTGTFLTSGVPRLGMQHLTILVRERLTANRMQVNVLMIGASNIWWVPLANVFGRRTINLLGLLMLTLCSMWAGLADGFWNLLAARFFMGAGGGSSDTVCPQVVGDLFFVHQRGRAMAVYTGMQAVGSLIGAVAGGYIAAGSGGLPWLHWTNVVLSATTLLLTFLFVPETLYRREVPLGAQDAADEEMRDKIRATRTEVLPVAETAIEFKPYTLGRSLSIGRYEGHLGRQFLALFFPLLLPGVWLVGLWYAGLVGGIVICSTVGPTIVAMPPYLWGQNVGLISVGAIIGSLVGAAYTYLVADLITKRAALSDTHGYSEPEPRLWAAVPGLVLATFGLMTFGFSAQYTHSYSWVGLEFGVGMLAFGLMSVPSVGFNFVSLQLPSKRPRHRLMKSQAYRGIHLHCGGLFRCCDCHSCHSRIRVVILRCRMGDPEGRCGALWYFRYAYGHLWPADHPNDHVWQENSNCDGKMAARDVAGMNFHGSEPSGWGERERWMLARTAAMFEHSPRNAYSCGVHHRVR